MMNIRIKRNFAVAVACLFGMFVGTSAIADEPLKVGFIFVGPITDKGWNHQHNRGRLELEQALAGKVHTNYVESVPEGPDSEPVLRQLAEDGHKLIFTTSYGYLDATINVAKMFPDVRFEHSGGLEQTENVSTYSVRFYEGRYVTGRIAGAMTKSNVVGYIAGYPVPLVIRGINAFALGLTDVNPKAVVKVVWLNTWYSPDREANAANLLIDQGADVITQVTDSTAPLMVAEERGVFAFGQSSDMSIFAPNAHLVSIVDNWGPYYLDRTRAVMDGTWETRNTWQGIADNALLLLEFNSSSLPADVIADANATVEAIRSGSFHPFTGPIKNQQGVEIVAKDEVMSDQQLITMDYYVMGVDDSLPISGQ